MEAIVIRQGELVGRQIMAYETTEEVGTVEHLLVDVKRAQVIGLVCKPAGLLPRRQSVSWSQLVKIGRDRILIHTEAAPDLVSANEAQLAAAQNMSGLEVWTDGGDRIGQVIDFCLDQATGDVQQYLFAPNDSVVEAAAEQEDGEAVGKPLKVYAIAPKAIISAGRKRMMIAEEDAQRAQPYGQPLHLSPVKTPGRVADWRSEPLPEIPTDLSELMHKGQSLIGKVAKRAKQFTNEQLAHQDFVEANSLPNITEQLQVKTNQAKHQMQEQFEKAKAKAQDQLDNSRLEDRLGKTPLGRLGKTLDRFRRPQALEEPIDIEAFEVWEDETD